MAKLETILNWSVEGEGHNAKGQKWHSTAMRVTPLAGGGMMTAPRLSDKGLLIKEW